jgi:predicted acylesterase/phospholipase RssA
MLAPLAQFAGTFTPATILWNLTLPVLSYFHGRGFSKILKDAFGETNIEDLWLRYFCVSTNLRQNDMNIHTRGKLWNYCRASMTVLGLLPPIIADNVWDITLCRCFDYHDHAQCIGGCIS